MRNWVAVMKAYYEAETYANALAVGEAVRQNAERELEDRDEVDVVMVLPLGTDEDRVETAALLRRARNSLIRLGHQRAVDVAREVDMIAHVLSSPSADLDYHPPYDYGTFLEVVDAITKGKDPGA